MWFKWHMMHVGLMIKSVFGGLGRHAVEDVNNANEKTERNIKKGSAVGYEEDVAGKYYEFWDLDFSNFGRMNTYFTVILLSMAFAMWHFFTAEHMVLNEDYLLMSALGIAVFVLVLFFYELVFRGGGEDLVVPKEEYEKAERWMHYIAEKSRLSMPWWALLIVGVGLTLEASAISVIAASFVSDISKNESMYIGIVLGLIVAAGLGYFVHRGGEALYREHHRIRLKRVINQEGGEKKEDGQWISETFCALKGDQNDFHTQEEGFLRRYGMLLSTIAIILALATAAFYQRAELNLEIIQGQQEEISDDMFMSADAEFMPAVVAGAQKESVNAIVSQDASHAENGMYAALSVLTLVFLIINGVGLVFGYKYCYFNSHSEEYAKVIDRYKKQQALKSRSHDCATVAKQTIIKKSKVFFAKYHRGLLKKSRREGNDTLSEALNDRGVYGITDYVRQRA